MHKTALNSHWNISTELKVILVLFLAVSRLQKGAAPRLCHLPELFCSLTCLGHVAQEESFSPASTGISPITKDKQTCFNNFFRKAKLSDFLKVKMKINMRFYTTLLASKDEIQAQPVTGNASEALPQLPSRNADKPYQFYPILFH